MITTILKSLVLSSLAGAAVAATVYRPAPNASITFVHDYPADMVSIARQDFVMGCDRGVEDNCHIDESPARHVVVERFRIDRQEVTVAQFAACVEQGACSSGSFHDHHGRFECNFGRRGNHPMNCVSWRGAMAFCSFVGKRLPYEREWEIAARGDDRRAYPWGQQRASCRMARVKDGRPGCDRSTAPVGSHPLDRSPFGLMDMAGNVAEWTASWYQGERFRVVRGGSWQSAPVAARAFRRSGGVPSAKMVDVGFRCAESTSVRLSRAP
ncbi:MAG: SUMF1/EgtB/PvdO family nonheme iron enzyme [Myxococcota bacterium]